MSYRDIRRPSSPSRPDDDDDDDDDDYKAVFNKLPSPCRPDSPVLPPIDYGADRIQNDLLDEICSDIGIKVCFIFTARKRSLGQGNIFAPVCHSVHRGECLVLGGVCSQRGSAPRGGVPGPEGEVPGPGGGLFLGGGAWSQGVGAWSRGDLL